MTFWSLLVSVRIPNIEHLSTSQTQKELVFRRHQRRLNHYFSSLIKQCSCITSQIQRSIAAVSRETFVMLLLNPLDHFTYHPNSWGGLFGKPLQLQARN